MTGWRPQKGRKCNFQHPRMCHNISSETNIISKNNVIFPYSITREVSERYDVKVCNTSSLLFFFSFNTSDITHLFNTVAVVN